MRDLHLNHLGNHNQILVVALLDPFYHAFCFFLFFFKLRNSKSDFLDSSNIYASKQYKSFITGNNVFLNRQISISCLSNYSFCCLPDFLLNQYQQYKSF